MQRSSDAHAHLSTLRASKRLLLVEDERIVAMDLRDELEELGYTVVGTAVSFDEAVAQTELKRPDLVLMDIRLAGAVDGIETAAVLRARFQVAVVFLTANDAPSTLERALDTEPGGYITKPYSQQSLLTTIEVALRRHEYEQAMQRTHGKERRRLEQRASAFAKRAALFREESNIDALTRLYNRRYLDEGMKRELALARRGHHPVGLILLDLDRFKAVNDTFGHLAADCALRAVADFLRANLRVYDIACRYGGEEMSIVIPGAGPDESAVLAEKLRAGLAALRIEYQGRPLCQITASFGVSAFPANGTEPGSLLQAADTALYRAKGEGRNRVAIAPASESLAGGAGLHRS